MSVSTTGTAPGRHTGGRQSEGQGYGLVLLASVLLVAIANSHVFTANAHCVFGNLRTWGWITLIIGVTQLLAAAGVLTGNELARWFAVAVVGLNASSRCSSSPPTRSGP